MNSLGRRLQYNESSFTLAARDLGFQVHFSHRFAFTKSLYPMQFPFHENVHMWIYFYTLFHNQENLTLIRCTPVGDNLRRGSEEVGI